MNQLPFPDPTSPPNRGEHTSFEPIAPPAAQAELLKEVDGLSASGSLASQGRFEVYLATADAIPHVLHEIGRLREIAFRAVGEGSGKSLDLDSYDRSYLHLFLWDREKAAVAGAYRLGRTDSLLSEFGPQGLYTSTLFQLSQPFLDHLTPGLELGRSFVALEYQKSIYPLSLLWKGIGRFVARFPRYARLFGPVSVSDNYSPVSQELMVRYLRKHRRHCSHQGWVQPFHPYRGIELESDEISERLHSIEEVSAAVAQVEGDGKGVPVLLRQYLKLNATLLEFNVDPNFSNVLDALVLVDLSQAADDLLVRYMGPNGLAAFRQATTV